MQANITRMTEFLTHLTENIGIRLAGSKEDKKAVDYICSFLQGQGVPVYTEEFPVFCRQVESQSLEVEINGTWQRYPCSLFSSVPGTAGQTLEADLVFFSGPADYQRSDLSFLRGKAVVHLGAHIESRESYTRLMEAEPAFILFVDIRYPGTVPLADGMFPAYTKDLGAKPSLNVAFQDAWNWSYNKASRARICIDGGMEKSVSHNIIIEFPGTDKDAGWIYAGAHHDTQADTVGADDDGSGCTVISEMAALLKNKTLKRGIKLILFGAEEQLSVGSAEYIRQHRAEIEKNALFMLNFDSCGSAMGWYNINVNGPETIKKLLKKAFHNRNNYPVFSEDIVPYTDQFPFSVCGIPGAWISRECSGNKRPWHHRYDDDLRHISFEELALQAELSADFLLSLANADSFPIEKYVPQEQMNLFAEQWTDLYGGWMG